MKSHLRMLGIQLAAVLLISACSIFGVKAPESFEDHIANAYTSLSAARDVSTTLAQHDRLTKEDFADFIKQCDSAREAIEAARTLHGTDATAGQQRLDVAIAMLTALNAYLQKREAGAPATIPTEVSNENRRPATSIHDLVEPADEGQRIGASAASSRSRGTCGQRRRFESLGIGGRRCASTPAVAA